MELASKYMARIRFTREGLAGWIASYVAIFFLAALLSLGIVEGHMRAAFVFLLLAVLGVLCFRIERGVVALLVYLPFMGLLRRWMYLFNPWVEFDPILVVSDVLVLLMFSYLVIFERQAIFASLRNNPLVKCVTFLLFVFFFQIFNPLQGGIMAGLAGAKFYVVPLLWFYVGLFVRGETVRKILYIWVAIGVVVALYGLNQTFFGFAGFEKYWIQWGGYRALKIGPYTRAFSTFVSAGEYAFFLMVCGTISFALFLRRRSIVSLLTLALMVFALLIAAVRTALFGLAFSILVLGLLQFKGRKRWAFALVVLSAMVFSAYLAKGPPLPFSAYYKMTDVEAFLSRTYSGLADPFGAESTLWVRFGTWSAIFRDVFTKNPLGYGIGATTFGGKFGGLTIGTESDIISFFASCGLVGGILFLVVLYQFFRQSLTVRARGGDNFLVGTTIALVAGFTLVGSFSLYSTGPFTWLLIGSIGRLWFRGKSIQNRAEQRSVPRGQRTSYPQGAAH